MREHFFEFLERDYPHLLEGYRRLYVRGYAPKGYTNEITAIANTIGRCSAGNCRH